MSEERRPRVERDSFERESQPDPLLREGPVSRWRIWALAAFIIALLVIVFIAITNPWTRTAGNAPQPSHTASQATSPTRPSADETAH